MQIIFYFGINLLALYVLNSALHLYLKPKEGLKSTLKSIPYLIYVFVGVFTYFLTRTPLLNIIIQAILVYLISINFNGNIKTKISLACIWIAFSMILEVLVSIVYAIMLSKSINMVVLNDISKIIACTIHTLFMLIIVKAGNLIQKNKAETVQLSLHSLYLSIIPLCSVCLLHIFATLSLAYTIMPQIVILFCMFIIFINIFFFELFDKLQESEKLKYENSLLKNQSEYFMQLEQNANNTFEKIRTIKHDLKYQLLFLKAKTEDKSNSSLEEIGNFLDTLIEDTLSEKKIEYTKNKSLNRLLNYKLFSISKKKIELDINVTIREDTYIDNVSLYTILGNAIDNAIRNFDSTNSSMKNIVIRIVDDCDNLFIKIANPYNKILKFKNGIPLTDKANKEFHGIGLQSIKNLVEQKNGHFKITSADNIFTLEVLLYDEIKHENSCQE